ncbi:DUF3833 domain-containing protein [Pseudoruegeria sp. HB172150]|uniref:DUF3833 domain-containing protein n=1 Tax=Pseudoruegeria sp. HB172150 TaxID=2721164 RepID=UPI00155308FD|nr:DUF3833 domain-containing protein [Pseudoruegeria sp. HB172150]
MKILTAILLIVLLGIAARNLFFSFRAQSADNYADTSPTFSVTEHLSGPILSEGVIFGPTGRAVNRFVARMEGSWDGANGTLTEDFTYANGSTQARKWTLTLGENGNLTAEADDIIGKATGRISGATINLRYRIVLPENSGGHTLDVDDWLYLTENGTILNRSEFRKFGIKVGELVATMRPAAPSGE